MVPVPTAEPVVSAWRARFDSSAAQGMPAHITTLYPFLDEDRLTDSVVARLSDLCAEVPVLDVEFGRIGRFPAVLYLDPQPADGLRQLTTDITKQWPEAPPYGGRFDEVVPHLTIANSVADDVLADIEDHVLGALPVRAQLIEAALFVFDGARWRSRARLPFGASRRDG
ncbi:MAG: 2'-5' RNA ligase family protein [Actinomycetota bacterium]|nr:2'-5' RNA ligase family protein [Actinomycetota bacterium]